MVRKFKLSGLPKDKDFNALPFGRQIDGMRAIVAFKATAKSVWVSQKRTTYTKAIAEAVKLYDVSQYFCQFSCDSNVKDDTFHFWYTSK